MSRGTLRPEQRDELLQSLMQMGSAGQAESESGDMFAKRYHPVLEHAKAFDPDVVLIVGDRGSGKSELFRAVFKEGLLAAISRNAPTARLPPIDPDRSQWIEGYPLPGAAFPDAAGQRQFVKKTEGEEGLPEQFWFAFLTRVLYPQLSESAKVSLSTLAACPGGAVDNCIEEFTKLGSIPLQAIDELDATLQRTDRWIFLGYDELDTLGGYDWNTTGTLIRGLVSFWANYSRRWKAIRAKIFIRTDLYRRHSEVVGAEIAKLAANRAELTWSDRNLYAMLVKRIANSSEGLRDYCVRSKIEMKQDSNLYFVPYLPTADAAKPLIDSLCQEYMGANANKGVTFRWIVDHVRDGRKRASPRTLVRLLERAAEQERSIPKAGYNHLLHPTALRRALDEVSRDHVAQAKTSEWKWLHGVGEALKGREVPEARRSIEKAFVDAWKSSWALGKEMVHPPVADPSALVEYLIELGVLRQRSDGRIDTPDLYLAGMGIKRKGGVRRK